jgi:aminopeptidase N
MGIGPRRPAGTQASRGPITILGVVLAAALLHASEAAAQRAYFPPTPAGWPGAMLDPGDVSSYLAFHKARAMERMQAMRTLQTPNQSAYDARTYDLDLRPDIPTSVLTGIVRMRATVVGGPLLAVDLDLYSNMVVDSAYADGAPTSFTHGTNILTVSLDRAYVNGEDFEVVVRYHGTPLGGPFGPVFAFDSHSGKPLIWTLSEPFGARSWWPCKDYPEDKADAVDIRVTVPSGMITACNGTRVESSDDGLKAFSHWHESHAIATYLVSVSSYAYAVSTDSYLPVAGGPMPIQFYLYPEAVAGAAGVNAKVKGMIAAYAARFGEYPFLDEKYGEAQFPWGGGMENQTLTSLGGFWEDVVAHELGHQWWGDMITCRDFHHVWLNEGFATYCEALWAEAGTGMAGYHAQMNATRYLGPGTVYAPDENNPGRVFDGNLSYNKGSWLLHMLRHALGDTTFFTGLRAYGQQYGYGAATTENFRDVLASVSGRNLDKFFQEWFYGEYYPQYRFGSVWGPAAGGYDVTVLIEQAQSWQLFWMPVDVTIHTADGAHTFVAMDSLPAQGFLFHVAQPPLSVELDPDQWILRTVETEVLAVNETPRPASLRLMPTRPNPVRGRATFAFWLPAPGPVRLTLVDITGARVRTLAAGALPGGSHELVWDGRDDRGRLVAPGMYAAHLEAAGERRVQKLVLVR